jgi:hypothetical protein
VIPKAIAFIVGCIILAIVLYVFHEMLPLLGLPAEIAHLATILLGLLGLLCLLYLFYRVFSGGPPGGQDNPSLW